MPAAPKESYWRRRLRSVAFAWRGMRLIVRTQPNARLHVVATLAACLLGFALQISRIEWCVILIAIVAVWTAEALNTALEFLCDVASPDFHPLIEQAKDVAAGGVLISSVGAALVALLIYGHPLWLRLLGVL